MRDAPMPPVPEGLCVVCLKPKPTAETPCLKRYRVCEACPRTRGLSRHWFGGPNCPGCNGLATSTDETTMPSCMKGVAS